MYKKLFCIALFFVMLVGMTCISASEDIISDAIANVEDLEVQSAPIDDANNDLSTNSNEDSIMDASKNDEKLNPHLESNVETNDAYVTITSTVDKNATGNVTIEITKLNDGKTVNGFAEIENGTATWSEFIAFDKGDYIADITYLGDGNYYSTSIKKVFEIEKLTTDLKVRASTLEDYVRVAAIVDESATGTVTIRIKTFEEENYTEYGTVDLENGIAFWGEPISFKKGDYVLFTEYNGDKNFFKAGSVQTFTIEKDRTELNGTVTTDDCFVQFNATVNENATGNIIIYIKTAEEANFTKYATEKIENGNVYWGEFIMFEKGDYELYAEYPGDDNFFDAFYLQKFSIEKEMPEIEVEITTYKAFATVTAKVTENATGNVTISIKTTEEENFTEYATVELEDGTAVWANPEPLDKGNYAAFVMYNGDENYFKVGTTQTFKIKKQMPDFDVNIAVDDYLIALNATLPEDATGNVTIYIKSDEEENFTEYATIGVENGTAVWADFAPFNKGDYIAYTTYSGDKKYYDNDNVQNFTIEKQFADMLINTIVNKENATMDIIVTLPEDATGVVTLTNNQTGEVIYATLEGVPIVFTEDLTFGYNVFQISYSGDDYYFGIENTVVEPVKVETSLSTKAKYEVTYKNSVKITVKLKVLGESGSSISDGENVTIFVNNKTYTGTLENGAVTIKIGAYSSANYTPNNFTATVTFDGNDYLSNSSTSFLLVVKKGTSKLTAKDKAYKVSTKTKKYTVTLKNHKNSVIKNTKVSLKVNGKTYKVKTNAKGQAIFKITNLNKKANYYALIKYNGSKYYTGTSAKVKITVK